MQEICAQKPPGFTQLNNVGPDLRARLKKGVERHRPPESAEQQVHTELHAAKEDRHPRNMSETEAPGKPGMLRTMQAAKKLQVACFHPRIPGQQGETHQRGRANESRSNPALEFLKRDQLLARHGLERDHAGLSIAGPRDGDDILDDKARQGWDILGLGGPA